MRKILLSLVALFGMGTAGFAQDTLRGVYQPPGSAWPTAPGAGKSGKASKPTLEAPNYGPVGGPVDAPPAVTVPGAPWVAPWTGAPLSRSQGRSVRARNLLTVQRLRIAKQ
jgi:hypothetical protein